ncbi:MAG TPA: methyltransferase dimerization domain-containing protein, partial [Pyrinomonadaceae bacterium]|nr:methyltransferase dimerization domain-containing protein [Pyrinomonadaceae bacterium]
MNDQANAAPHQMPPEAQLMQMLSGAFVSAAVYVAAKLGIPGLRADGAKTTTELAAESATDEHSLYRLLRALASVGIFTESEGRLFANTPMSDTLRADAPNSTLYMTLWMFDEQHWRVYGHLLESVQTGKTVWDKVYGEPVFKTLFETNRE